jgi:hypothetical protein
VGLFEPVLLGGELADPAHHIHVIHPSAPLDRQDHHGRARHTLSLDVLGEVTS